MVPDLDHPLCGTGEEDGGDVGVPRDVVDGGVVGGVGCEILGGIFRGALVDQALVRAHQEHGLVVRVEGDAAAALCRRRTGKKEKCRKKPNCNNYEAELKKCLNLKLKYVLLVFKRLRLKNDS